MSEDTDEAKLWELAGYVKGGTHRYDVFCHLARNGPAIPSEVASATDKTPQRVYDAQSELEERELIELKVPESQRKGRLRALTERGQHVWEFMMEQGIVREHTR